jgi:formylglycine-generating enzyme required for sulfatase activity
MKGKANFIKILLFCVACYCLLPDTASATRGIVTIPIKDKNGTEVGIYDESHALVIGGSDYTGGWPKLPGVEKDIILVKEALEAKGFNVVLVRNPDGQELENAFERFIDKYGYKSNNRLLFYFAGHGHTIKPQYGGEALGYIVPVEAPNPYDDLKKFRRVSMSMQRIEEYALSIDAKHALFIFDSCFSGSLFALSRAVPEHISYKTAKPVRLFITSGSADEKVPDTSIFRQQFITALGGEGDLNGDGYMTGAELSDFVFKNVVNYSKGAQHPQYGKIRNPNLDKGDFVFRMAQLESMERGKNFSSSDQVKSVTVQPVTEKTPKRYAEEILLLEKDLVTMDEKIATMKKDLSTTKLGYNDGLAAVLTLVEEKEQQQQRLDELRKKWQQAVENDITVYEKIVHSSSGHDLKETAWKQLVVNYPDAANLATGSVDELKMLLFKKWVEPTTGMEFVWIEGGCFQMGDTFGEGDNDEKPVHEVCVGSFGMSKHELSQGQWQKIMGNNPSKFTKGNNYPVEQVSWFDTLDFIRKFNSQTGKSFRLPTEAEWEYAACSGGKKEKYAGGSDINRLGWHEGNSADSTHPVGTKEPNGLGLYDMSGNVWEWCSDWYDKDYYQNSLRNNPRGPSSGSFHVIRDGCWNCSPWLARCSNRDGFRPSNQLDNLGFRLVLPVK